MNPSLSDPNNHVPEVSPDDGWGDAKDFPTPVMAPGTVLPPRRTVADRSSAALVTVIEPDQTGLRIDSNLTRVEPADSPQRLVVQEITGSVVRLDQGAPPPPKVARQVTFHERPAHENDDRTTQGEGQQWGVTRSHPALWIVAAGAVIGTVILSAMMLLPFINATNAPREIATAPLPIEEKIEGGEAMNFLLTKQPEAMQIYRAYVTASHVDDVVPIILDGAALKETLRKHWHPLEVSKQWSPAADSPWAVAELGSRPCGIFGGTLPDHSSFNAIFTFRDNRLLLDWKATAAFGTATFAQLAKGEGDPAEIRGTISPAQFYTAAWPDADYQSYRFLSPDGESVIWCYTRRNSLADAAIAPLFHRGEIVGDVKTSRNITIRLERGPDGALPNQWLVGDMLSKDWVSP